MSFQLEKRRDGRERFRAGQTDQRDVGSRRRRSANLRLAALESRKRLWEKSFSGLMDKPAHPQGAGGSEKIIGSCGCSRPQLVNYFLY